MITKSDITKSYYSAPKNILEGRKLIVENLRTKNWFKKTSVSLQKELLSLPEDFDGFLVDLSRRPESIGQVEVLKLDKLLVGNYIATAIFAVRSHLTNEVFTHEFVSWKYGRFPGYRGIILVEVDNKIKFFMVRKGYKFPIASQIYDAIGTFDITFSKDKFINFSVSVENKIKKLLGVSDINFKRFIDLGLLNPDAGLTNEHVALFATIINIEDARMIEKSIGGKELTSLVTGFEIEVHPIERLLEFVAKSDDSFFLACAARLMALNIINL